MKSIVRLLVPAGTVLAIGGLFAGVAAADNNQTASNVASSVQSVAAVSGDAAADGTNSTATSGSASAAAILTQSQAIFQSLQTANTSDSQTGDNAAGSEQGVVAASGVAVALAGGSTTTGNAAAISDLIQAQLIEQFGISESTVDGGDDENGGEEENGEE